MSFLELVIEVTKLRLMIIGKVNIGYNIGYKFLEDNMCKNTKKGHEWIETSVWLDGD